jgi:hypothetical protein
MDVHNFLDIVAQSSIGLTSKSMNNAVREKISCVKNRAYDVGSYKVSILSLAELAGFKSPCPLFPVVQVRYYLGLI